MPHKLGQVFLKNKKKIKKIIDSLELKPKETLIEIGAGYGQLTKEIIKRKLNLNLILIEKDKNCISVLKKLNYFNNQVTILEGDVLKILNNSFLKTIPKKYKIVGNIPYYLTGRLLRILSNLANKPEIIVFTVQKEVALRITAKAPKMNLLAAILQFWANSKIIDFIARKNFSPIPKVDSAILKIKPKKEKIDKEIIEKYYQFVKILFKQPRKTIFNNLKRDFKEKVNDLKNKNTRAQELNLKKIILLFKKCYNIKK